MDDGTLYTIPAVYESEELMTAGGPLIREDFSKKIGVSRENWPLTFADWEQMFVDAKNHPDLQNVIPFMFSGIGVFTDIPVFLGAWGIRQEWYHVDGKVKFGAVQPEYKEFLSLMRRWYSMGFIDTEFAANTGKMQDEKVTSDRVLSLPGYMGGSVTRYTAIMRPTNPDFTLLPVNYPILETGAPVSSCNRNQNYIGGIAITTAAKDPDMMCQFYDYFYSDEGHILTNWGVEGISYEYNAKGELDFLPLVKNNPDGLSREQAMAKYTIWQSISAVYKKKDVLEQRDSLPEQIQYRRNWLDGNSANFMPLVTPTIEESTEFAAIMTDVNNFYRETATNIIMGAIDLDSGFDNMVNTLNGMGIQRATELRQDAYDRFMARP